MKNAIYAGSFDPWSFGHQYVLDQALQVFGQVHVVVAVNPAKQGWLTVDNRARLIAHAIDPLQDWWQHAPPFHIGNKVVVTTTSGLVVDYALSQKIDILLRGLRSTSDFEAEFNLYFSNHAIDPHMQTWSVMCPPELLHCSSTYVRTVVGASRVTFVGTSFTAQALMLHKSKVVGKIFDLIQRCSQYRFECQPADLTSKDLNEALQLFYARFLSTVESLEKNLELEVEIKLAKRMQERAKNIQHQLKAQQYPAEDIAFFWSLLFYRARNPNWSDNRNMHIYKRLLTCINTLGKTQIPLFEENLVEKYLHGFAKNPSQSF